MLESRCKQRSPLGHTLISLLDNLIIAFAAEYVLYTPMYLGYYPKATLVSVLSGSLGCYPTLWLFLNSRSRFGFWISWSWLYLQTHYGLILYFHFA